MKPSITPAYDLSPLLQILLLGGLLAMAPVAWLWLRQRDARPAARLRALTMLALFLTFDLVLVGAFTRLTDSGLGCPDWPGCYGRSTPAGAHAAIEAAQQSMPSGPVTHGKAWMEMVHRYLATGVGGLITGLAGLSWLARFRADRGPRATAPVPSPWWPTVTLAWVCLQGAFGAWTVTMKLYPAIVTLHLLGGIGLLALLAVQSQSHVREPLGLAPGLRMLAVSVAALSVVQIALGGWVSTNYAVLACRDLPTCQGSFWPSMDFVRGFTLRRPLGLDGDGSFLPFSALTAIHFAHRLGACVVLPALGLLAWRLRAAADPALHRWGLGVAGVALWQLLSGLGNVVLGWPLAAALAHTGGAALLIVLLTILLTRATPASARSGLGVPHQPRSPSGPPRRLHQAP